jgi:hypothetical protein
MQFMLLIYDDGEIWQGFSEEEQKAIMGEYFAFTDELREAGAYVAADALQPIGTATTVRIREGEQLLTDGPFAETKEQLGGYYVVDVDSIDEAIQWAAKIPSARFGSIEVRPVMVYDREGVGA